VLLLNWEECEDAHAIGVRLRASLTARRLGSRHVYVIDVRASSKKTYDQKQSWEQNFHFNLSD